MSVNSQHPDEMVRVATSPRDVQAHHAASALLDRNNIVRPYVSQNHVSHDSDSPKEWNPQREKMSNVRRTFCLVTTFDLILTFILWVIYTQLIGKNPIWQAFDDQVFNYDFKTSLFDTVMMSAVRFTFILLAYALFRLNHWWTIALTTSLTCAFLLVKCFLFRFNDEFLGGKNPLSYVLLIICFVMAWVETWILDFKVIPHEKKLRERSQLQPDERTPLIGGHNSLGSSDDEREYYSPIHTPDGSDDENTETKRFHSVPNSRGHSRKEIEDYYRLLEDAEKHVKQLMKLEDWKQAYGKTLEEGCVVHNTYSKELGRKIYRLRGYVDFSPKGLWEEMIYGFADAPQWNPTLIETKILQIIDDTSDVIYSVSAEAGAGLVSARDFLSVRHWKEENGVFYSLANGCKHPDMPPQKQYVRGENGPCAWIMEPVPGEPNRCLFTWVMTTNLKGWLPQGVVDQAMTGVLTDYLKYLIAHLEQLTQP